MPAKPLTILFFGDIVGKPGRRAMAAVLPELKRELQPDMTIANAENIAHGIGITRKTLDECRAAGVDFFTSGNHVWKKPEVLELFHDASIPLIRPANDPTATTGAGFRAIPVGEHTLVVINLNGQVFLEQEYANPFHEIDRILSSLSQPPTAGILVDFHAEATSEKVAFGWHVDGRVSAVLGTHTHVPTADETILPKGTAYITDVGMVGLKESVIGVDKDIILGKFLGERTGSHDIPDHGLCVVNAVRLTIDPATRQATSIDRIHREITI